MKRMMCIFITVSMLFLSSCQNYEYKELKTVAFYNDELYEEAKNWHPLGNETHTEKAWIGYIYQGETPTPGKLNGKVILYENDINMLFIGYDPIVDEVLTLHKVSHSLPAIYSDSVDKVKLRNMGETGEIDLYLEGELLADFLDCLKTYYENNSEIAIVPWVKDISGIEIYFEDDFPAYYDGNELVVQTSDGKYALAQLEGLSLEESVLLPESISEYIEDQLQD